MPRLWHIRPGRRQPACPAGGPTSTAACIVDAVLASGTKSGYAVTLGCERCDIACSGFRGFCYSSYHRAPVGVKGFCAEEDGVVRFETPASAQRDELCKLLASDRTSVNYKYGEVPGGGYKPGASDGNIRCSCFLWVAVQPDCPNSHS